MMTHSGFNLKKRYELFQNLWFIIYAVDCDANFGDPWSLMYFVLNFRQCCYNFAVLILHKQRLFVFTKSLFSLFASIRSLRPYSWQQIFQLSTSKYMKPKVKKIKQKLRLWVNHTTVVLFFYSYYEVSVCNVCSMIDYWFDGFFSKLICSVRWGYYLWSVS